MNIVRAVLSVLWLVLFGVPAFVAGAASLTVVPRETCNWDTDFCSDYAGLYGATALLFTLMLIGALWATFRFTRRS